MTDIPAAALFTLSEQVFLQGDRFAAKAGIVNKVKLMHVDQEVSATDLVTQMMATALLANERAGALRLEIRQKKALFGLTKVTTLYAEPLQRPNFPSPSLEISLYDLAVALKNDKEKHEVSNIVYAWLSDDTNLPWQKVVQYVQRDMAARGVLSVVQEKKLKVFTVSNYVLPDSTRNLATQISSAPVQAMLEDCRNRRPDLWQVMTKHIKNGIDSRHESRDD